MDDLFAFVFCHNCKLSGQTSVELLKPTLEEEFGWTNSDYANIASVFQFSYAISMLFAGRIIDKLGTKWGFAWAIIIWSLGAAIHGFAIPRVRQIYIIK